jgi:hypothetical protein
MKFYAIANEDYIDSFYDLSMSSYSDGLSRNSLMATEDIAEAYLDRNMLPSGKVIPVHMSINNKGVQFGFDSIWF